MSKPFTARDVADLVISELKPLLEAVAARMPAKGELDAINAGITGILAVQTELGELAERNGAKLDRLVEDVKQLDATVHNLADNQMKHAAELKEFVISTIDDRDRLGARVYTLEGRKGGDDEETKLVEGLEG